MNYETWYQQLINISTDAAYTLNKMSIPETAAIVFDIDDTLIHSNGKCIMPIINLFNYIKKMGIIVILITNRSGDRLTIDYTQKQLIQCGINGYKSLYFREPSKPNDPYRYKIKARLNVHERGMIVVMSIGDQIWDVGEYAGIGYILPVYI